MKKLYLNWNNKNTLRQFIEQMEYCKSSSEKEVNIVAPDRMRTYPDICAPLSALIDEYNIKIEDINLHLIFQGKTIMLNILAFRNRFRLKR